MDKRLQILREAMEIELNGIQLYGTAAVHVEDKQAKEVFQFLSDEEKKHYQYLKNAFDSISKGEEIEFQNLLPPRIPFDSIFSQDFKRNLKGKAYEYSAIATGIILEKNSIDFYRREKEDAESSAEKELYEELEKWEEKHYEMLNKEYNDLKVRFWDENRFYPF